jgi:INO80 complex subunit C
LKLHLDTNINTVYIQRAPLFKIKARIPTPPYISPAAAPYAGISQSITGEQTGEATSSERRLLHAYLSQSWTSNRYKMAPLTTASDEKTHQALLDKLDIYAIPKPFRNPNWKPPQRRNKNLKQIIGEASRKEASQMATQNNSGISTPVVTNIEATTPAGNMGRPPNIAQAAQSLSTLVLEKNGRATVEGNVAGPAATYTNIESAPSFHPSSQKKYCDITGLPAPYTDPKTRLRYHNKEVFGTIRTMPQNVYEGYLEARGAHTILK